MLKLVYTVVIKLANYLYMYLAHCCHYHMHVLLLINPWRMHDGYYIVVLCVCATVAAICRSVPGKRPCTAFQGVNAADTIQIPYACERGPTTEYLSTPHFGINFLLRSSVYLNMRPCVAALEIAAQMAGL